MHDSHSSLEGIIGWGFRHKYNNTGIIGVYGFWDIRRIKNVNNQIHQATIGTEYLAKYYELRVNGCLTKNKNYLYSNSNIITSEFNPSTLNTSHTISNRKKYETPLGGFDIEFGGTIPKLSQLQVFGSFYHFSGKSKNQQINGIHFRSELSLHSWVKLTSDISNDKNRGLAYYVGLKFNFENLYSKNNTPSSLLHKKMT